MALSRAPTTRARRSAGFVRADGEPDGGLSLQIMRTSAGILARVKGCLDQPGQALLRHLLIDLIEGQGNMAVTVDAVGVVAVEPTDTLFAAVAKAARARGVRFAVKTS